MQLNRNVGKLDRAIRTLVAIGIALLYLFDVISGILGMVLTALAIILLITSLVNFCPLYKIIGFNSCKFDPEN
ncbi:YgaP family membrane protein [Psychroflexus planctonicus]|uniref:Inner membrane protein YgaP-like transmembrane domain-containing protein n=1 Tax=Psychroflexus planctonicus TaxID=1526575 RepID=A0ABQ1SNM3_9FLAO|nr:DUF2892 domain-containing protein [Psychroflexus planctonicus]GGE43542.1 hypothetical protein GCM10010832_24390 [Psychroflexus planctonicus]